MDDDEKEEERKRKRRKGEEMKVWGKGRRKGRKQAERRRGQRRGEQERRGGVKEKCVVQLSTDHLSQLTDCLQ